ncbi:MAG: hypothetical protein IIC67_05540, partial [Thaumarchaeota archaeon]|nr:hypothetical protein [Nitrososphaerota archaeon]
MITDLKESKCPLCRKELASDEYDAALGELKNKVEESYKLQQETFEQEHNSKLEQLHAQHKELLKTQKQTHEVEITRMESDISDTYKKQLEFMENNYDSMTKQSQKQFTDLKKQLELDHKKDLLEKEKQVKLLKKEQGSFKKSVIDATRAEFDLKSGQLNQQLREREIQISRFEEEVDGPGGQRLTRYHANNAHLDTSLENRGVLGGNMTETFLSFILSSSPALIDRQALGLLFKVTNLTLMFDTASGMITVRSPYIENNEQRFNADVFRDITVEGDFEKGHILRLYVDKSFYDQYIEGFPMAGNYSQSGTSFTFEIIPVLAESESVPEAQRSPQAEPTGGTQAPGTSGAVTDEALFRTADAVARKANIDRLAFLMKGERGAEGRRGKGLGDLMNIAHFSGRVSAYGRDRGIRLAWGRRTDFEEEDGFTT